MIKYQKISISRCYRFDYFEDNFIFASIEGNIILKYKEDQLRLKFMIGIVDNLLIFEDFFLRSHRLSAKNLRFTWCDNKSNS